VNKVIKCSQTKQKEEMKKSQKNVVIK